MNKNKETSWMLVMKAAQALRDYAMECGNGSEQCQKVTVAQQRVLEVVFHEEGEINVKAVARQLNLTPGAVSQTVEILVRDGMVERVESKKDRRSVVIRPTAKSRDIRRKVVTSCDRLMEEAFETANENERKVFVRLLEKIINKAAKGPRALEAAFRAADGAAIMEG